MAQKKQIKFLSKLSTPTKNRLVAFVAGALLYLIALLIYNQNSYYFNYIGRSDVSLAYISDSIKPFLDFIFSIIGRNAYAILWRLYYGYLIIGVIKLILKSNVDLKEHRAYVFCQTVIKFFRNNSGFLSGKNISHYKSDFSDYEKINARYFLVKLIFLPIMLNFFFGNFSGLFNFIHQYNLSSGHQDLLYRNGYFAILNALFIIDISIFTVGYAFEFKKYSKVRSVEPTILGWVVALMCYPPFNDLGGKFLGWGSSDYAIFSTQTMTLFFAGATVLLYTIYVWATVALGLKSSNLTNRGIVSKGPYKYVRHPAYAAKNLAWIIMGIPAVNFKIVSYQLQFTGTNYALQFSFLSLNWVPLIALIAWAIIYTLRAYTEERHLLKDPDYQKYCKKVRYRFIPKVY